jgi:hypothetical protein
MGDGFHADSGAPPPNDAPPEFSVAPGGQWGVTVRDKVNYVTPTIAGFSASTSWDAPLADQPPLTLGPDLSFSGSYGNYGNATLHARYADAPESQPTPAPSTPPATPTRAVQKAIDVIPDEFLLPQYRRNPSPETYRLSPGVRLVGGIFWFDDDAGNRMSDSDIALTAIVGSF